MPVDSYLRLMEADGDWLSPAIRAPARVFNLQLRRLLVSKIEVILSEVPNQNGSSCYDKSAGSSKPQ
jgi:hypothetical protein